MMLVRGTTRVTLIIGHPIAQVRSPALFNRRFRDLGSDSVMIPADISPKQLPYFLDLLRGWNNADGCVVTIPHKRAIVGDLDELTERAERLGAVNVVRRMRDGRLKGDNVDGLGFLNAAKAHGFDPDGRAALVIGCGGAGSAIADALCASRIRLLMVRDIDPQRALWLTKLLGEAFPSVTLSVSVDDDLSPFDLVANASPVGMSGTAELPIPASAIASIRADALVADVVTEPAMTPFLQLAELGGRYIQQGPETAAGQTELLGRFIGCLP
jgi:shikimate dehydrogenase